MSFKNGKPVLWCLALVQAADYQLQVATKTKVKPQNTNIMNTKFKYFSVLIILVFLINACSNEDDGDDSSINNIEVSIDENPTTGDLITTLSSNLSGDVSYTLTSSSISQAFDLDSSGELRVLAWQLFDFETTPFITATATATNGTDSENKIIVVNLNDKDDIAFILSTSLNAYETAADGEWIQISAGEYSNLASRILGVDKTGQLDNNFDNSESIIIGGADFTVSNNNGLHMPEASYLFSFRYYTNENNNQGCKVKLSETSHQTNFETVGSNLPTHDFGYNYFVLKGNNSATNDLAYLGIYESNTIGYKLINPASVYFYESGDAEDLSNTNDARSYLYQGLSTTVKQWD